MHDHEYTRHTPLYSPRDASRYGLRLVADAGGANRRGVEIRADQGRHVPRRRAHEKPNHSQNEAGYHGERARERTMTACGFCDEVRFFFPPQPKQTLTFALFLLFFSIIFPTFLSLRISDENSHRLHLPTVVFTSECNFQMLNGAKH